MCFGCSYIMKLTQEGGGTKESENELKTEKKKKLSVQSSLKKAA